MNSLKIAKIIGVLEIGGAVLGVLVLGLSVISADTITGVQLFLSLVSVILAVICGYGLIKSRRWAIYLFFIFTLVPIINNTLTNINNGKTQKLLMSSQVLGRHFTPNSLLGGYLIFALAKLIQIVVGNLFGFILSYYFYRNRDKFLPARSKNK